MCGLVEANRQSLLFVVRVHARNDARWRSRKATRKIPLRMPRKPKNLVPVPFVRLETDDVPRWVSSVRLPPGEEDALALLNDLRSRMAVVERDDEFGRYLRELAEVARRKRKNRRDTVRHLVDLHPGFLLANCTRWVHEILGTEKRPPDEVRDEALFRKLPGLDNVGRPSNREITSTVFKEFRPRYATDADAYDDIGKKLKLSAGAIRAAVERTSEGRDQVGHLDREAAHDDSICTCRTAKTTTSEQNYLVIGLSHRHCCHCDIAAPIGSPFLSDSGDGAGFSCPTCRGQGRRKHSPVGGVGGVTSRSPPEKEETGEEPEVAPPAPPTPPKRS